MAVCSSGSQTRLAVDDSAFASQDFTDEAATKRYVLVSETMTGKQAQIDISGMNGTRERRAQELVDGPIEVSGAIEMFLSPGELNEWAPRILGGAGVDVASTWTFDMAETIPEFGMLIDKVASNGTRTTFAYKGCKVSSAVIRGSAGGPIFITLNIIAKTRDFHGEVFPTVTTALLTGATAQPYVFHESTVLYNSLSFQYNQLELLIDNLAEARLENSINVEEICATDQGVFLNINVPWIDAFAPSFDIADVTGNLALTKSPYASTFTFGELVQTTDDPKVPGKGQIRWPLQLEGRLSADGATPAIQLVNDLAV